MRSTGSARRSAGIAAGVAVAYLALAQYITWLNDPVNTGASFWPAAGVSVAALLLVPTRHWWMVVCAVLVCETGANLANGFPPGPSVSWGVANAVEPLVGAALVRRLLPSASLVPARNLVLFLACAAGVAPAVGATIGATVVVEATGAP